MLFDKFIIMIITFIVMAFADFNGLSPNNEIYRSQKYVVLPFDTLENKKGVLVYDINNGALLTKISPVLGENAITGVSISDESGRIIITAIDYSIEEDMGRISQCYDSMGKLLWKYPLAGENFYLISPSGAYATKVNGADVVVLDGKTGKPIHAIAKSTAGDNSDMDSVLMSTNDYSCVFGPNDELILIQEGKKALLKFDIKNKTIVAKQKIDIDSSIQLGNIGRPSNYNISSSASHRMFSAAFFMYKNNSKGGSIGSVVFSWDYSLTPQLKVIVPEPIQKLRMLNDTKVLLGFSSRSFQRGKCIKLCDINDKSTTILDDSPYYSEFSNAILSGDTLFYQMRPNKRDPYRKTNLSIKMDIKNIKNVQNVDAIPVFNDLKKTLKVEK